MNPRRRGGDRIGWSRAEEDIHAEDREEAIVAADTRRLVAQTGGAPMHRVAVIILVALSSNVAHAFDRKPWLADYAALKQALERDYGHLAWFGSPEGGVRKRRTATICSCGAALLRNRPAK